MSDGNFDDDRRSARVVALLTEVADRGRTLTTTPPFEPLAARGRALRRTRRAGVAVAAVAVIATTFAAVQDTTHDASAPLPAQPAPSVLGNPKNAVTDHSTIPLTRLTPEQIVHDTYATVGTTMALSELGGDSVASTWQLCRFKHCRKALALSSDDFDTVGYADITRYGAPMLSDAGGGAVLIADGSGGDPVRIVSPDGSMKRVTVVKAASPRADGETLVAGPRWASYLMGFFGSVAPIAIDGRSASTHPLPVRDGQLTLAELEPNGVVMGFGGSAAGGGPTLALWSTDDGATWQTHPVTGNGPFVGPLATTAPDILAFRVIQASSTELPSILRSLDVGKTWEEAPLGRAGDDGDPGVVIDRGQSMPVVLPDGSLLISVATWSDNGQPGLYRSDRTDWSTLQLVDPAIPATAYTTDTSSGSFVFELQQPSVDPDTGDVTLYALDREQQLFSSTDAGQTWTERPIR
ncbi:MAG: sialidase family protein [Nocardioidaceae bacterium]